MEEQVKPESAKKKENSPIEGTDNTEQKSEGNNGKLSPKHDLDTGADNKDSGGTPKRSASGSATASHVERRATPAPGTDNGDTGPVMPTSANKRADINVRPLKESTKEEDFHLPEIPVTPRNTKFNSASLRSNGKSSASLNGDQKIFMKERQPSEAVSISGVLKDVEFDPVPVSSEPVSEMDDHTIDITTADVTPKDKRVTEQSQDPSSVPGKRPSRRKPQTKKIAHRSPRKVKPPAYEHIHVHRHVIHYRTRITKVFTKPPKITLMRSEANYIRMCNIVLTIGCAMLREVFRSHIESLYPPKDIKQFLENYKRRMIGFSSTEKLLSARWKRLYPDDGSPGPPVEDLDAAILFWFLRHLCHLTKPTDIVWKWKPAHDDVSVVADIARIRDHRNSLINCVGQALYDEEFERKIEDFKAMILRMVGKKKANELVEDLQALQSAPVKNTDKDTFVEQLNHWAEETKDLDIGKITPAHQDWDTVNQCKIMTKRFLKRFKRSKVFTRTQTYQKAKEKLNANGFVILKGNTGEGKTTLALGVMASMFDEDDMLIISSFEQIKYVNRHSVGALLIDDLLGSMHFDEKQYNEWEPYFDQLYKFCTSRLRDRPRTGGHIDLSGDRKEKPTAKVIITMRKHVFNQLWTKMSAYKLFSDEYVVECNSKDLLFQEKRTMLARHITADHKVKSEVDKSAKLPVSKLGFPQSCALFVSQEAFMDLGSQFFETPQETLQKLLDKLYHSDMYGYLALVIMMFQPGGALFLKKLEIFTEDAFKAQVLDLASVCEVPVTEHLPALCLMALANSLKPYVYYYDDIGCYTFAHESILEIMMSTFVQRHPQHVLEKCALQFVMEYVATEDNVDLPRDQVFVMKLKKNFYWLMAQLFDHYMNYGFVYKIAQHRAFRDPKFLHFFFNYIKKRDMKEELILQVDNAVTDREENGRHVGFLYGAVDQDVPNADLAIAILKLGIHVRRPFNPEWCLSELRSTLCVAIRRRNFPIYHAVASTKLEIPDKVMMDKEYLKSVEIVTDILKRRSWSKEQKDIALVRASRQSEQDSSEVVNLLLLHGASVSSIRAGTTALCEAVKSGKVKTVTFLLSSGASIYDRDLNEQTPLHHACDWDKVEIARLLLQRGADINTKDITMLSPFLVAAGWGRVELMDVLLTRRADPLATDNQDNTVLHICAATGQTATMRAVMDKYPDETHGILVARNKYGWTPLDFAIKCGHFGVTKVLVRAILQNDTPRPGHKAIVHGRFSVVKLENLNREEMHLHRFVDLDSDKECFQIPRCRWYIRAGPKDEYDKVTHFISKYEDRLKLRGAKS